MGEWRYSSNQLVMALDEGEWSDYALAILLGKEQAPSTH